MAQTFYFLQVRIPADLGEWLETKAREHSSKAGYVRELLEKEREREKGMVRCFSCGLSLAQEEAQEDEWERHYCPACMSQDKE